MTREPTKKRVISFIDGQNLFFSVKNAFGYMYPNFDPLAISEAVCDRQGWLLESCRFYTGIPDRADNPRWNAFWNKKLAVRGRGEL